MTRNQMLALKAAAILWVVWGLVHMFAGVMTITQDTAGSVAGIADAVDPALLAGDYHPAVGAVLNQHGFNLLWIGTYTLIAAIFIWRANLTAVWTAAIVGGVTDVGYFIFMDLGGFVNFVPGTVMTLVSASAILLSVPLWWINRSEAAG